MTTEIKPARKRVTPSFAKSQDRERFEEWAQPDTVQAMRHPETGEYINSGMSAAWAGWQAAVATERLRQKQEDEE